jgi:hypothetical protein
MAEPLGTLQGDAVDPNQAPVGVEPPSFSQSFGASWEALKRDRIPGAEWRNQADFLDGKLDDYFAKTGERLANPLRAQWVSPDEGKALIDANQKKFASASMNWPSDDEIVKGGIDKARKALDMASLSAQQPQSFASLAGRQAAGMADPFQLAVNGAALALAPEGGLLVRGAFAGASVAGATEAENILGYGYRRQVEPQLTPGEAFIKEPIETGAAAAALDIGGGLLWKGLGASWRRIRGTPAAERAPLPVQDAGNVAEKAADVTAQQPFQGTTANLAHTEAVTATERSLLDNLPVELPAAAKTEAGAPRGNVFYPGGSVNVKYELAEASELVTSHHPDGRINPDYPAELQPRDRASAASLDQVNTIASRLEPERLAPNTDANHGPPIVGPDNVVESGNGRTAAIRTVYDRLPDQAAAYRGWLEANGHDTTGFHQPVLIGRRLEDMGADRATFARSLTDSGLRLNAVEQALSDARHLSPDALYLAKPGEVDSAANRDLVRSFLGKIPQSERGAMVTKAGQLSANGKRRLEAALNARAYGDADLVARLYEHPDPNIKTVGHGLKEAAIPWAKMRDAVRSGEIAAGQDITDAVTSAVKSIMRARDEGQPVWLVMNQGDLFHSDIAQAAARMFFKDDEMSLMASQKAIAANLSDYAKETLKNTEAGRLFGEPLKPEEIARAVTAKTGAAEPHTADLIEQAAKRAGEDRGKPVKPEEANAAHAELERMRDQGDNKIFMLDEKGDAVETAMDGAMKEAEDRAAMAKALRDSCNSPGGGEEP